MKPSADPYNRDWDKGNMTLVKIPTFLVLQRLYTAPADRNVPLLIANLAGLQIHCKREDRAQRQADGKKKSTGTSETDESRLTGKIYLCKLD